MVQWQVPNDNITNISIVYKFFVLFTTAWYKKQNKKHKTHTHCMCISIETTYHTLYYNTINDYIAIIFHIWRFCSLKSWLRLIKYKRVTLMPGIVTYHSLIYGFINVRSLCDEIRYASVLIYIKKLLAMFVYFEF